MDRLAAMETFVRVVDAGSFSSAAKQLRIGQPGVSKSVAQLEDRLGVRLLLRSTHGLMPTEAGRDFYDRAKRLIEEADEAERAARGAAATLTGRLRICVTSPFARLHVVHRLPAFLALHPELDLDVVLPDGDIDLIEAGIDVALRIGPLRDSVLTARKIAYCRRRVVGTPAYFAANGVPRTPADLIARQAIICEINERQPGGSACIFRQGTAETSVTLSGRVRVTAAEGVREAVFAGLGFAIACEWTFAPELKSGCVVPVLDDWSLPDADLWAVFPTGKQASVKARAFAGFIEQQLARITDIAISSPSAACELGGRLARAHRSGVGALASSGDGGCSSLSGSDRPMPHKHNPDHRHSHSCFAAPMPKGEKAEQEDEHVSDGAIYPRRGGNS